MLGECADYLKRRFLGPPGCPPVMGSLDKQLAIDIVHDFPPSELWPLHELKVPASLMRSPRQHLPQSAL